MLCALRTLNTQYVTHILFLLLLQFSYRPLSTMYASVVYKWIDRIYECLACLSMLLLPINEWKFVCENYYHLISLVQRMPTILCLHEYYCNVNSFLPCSFGIFSHIVANFSCIRNFYYCYVKRLYCLFYIRSTCMKLTYYKFIGSIIMLVLTQII